MGGGGGLGYRRPLTMRPNLSSFETETPALATGAGAMVPDRPGLELRASELSYRRLFETAQDGILILDADTGAIEDVNPFLFQLLGYSKAEMIGRTIRDLSPPADYAANEAIWARLQREGFVRYEDRPMQRKDGSRAEVEFVCNSYQAGARIVVQCNVRDISVRKAAEQQLRLLSASVAHLNDIVLITDANVEDPAGPRIVFTNGAFERITGYSAAEVLGRSPSLLQGPETSPGVLAEIKQALARGEPIRRELINYRKDGTTFWCDLDIVPVRDAEGKCSHYAAIERDVTARKRSEARFRSLFDTNVQCVAFWQADGAVTEANDAFLELAGYSRADLAAGQMNWLRLTPPEYGDVERRAMAELAATGVCKPYEKALLRPDGTPVPVLVGAAFLDEQRREGVCFLLDLRERKDLERQFLRSQRMESIGTLAGGIAHDLNNILAPIVMSIELLKRLAVDRPEAMTLLESIEVSAQRGSDIVRQVLLFARGTKGEQVRVLPKVLLDDLKVIVQDTFPRNIQLKFSVPLDTWPILGDPTQIHQILLNLCVNARDAMPGGGRLEIDAENLVRSEQYLGLDLHAPAGRYVNITVRDSGCGIPSANIDKIFDPFFTTKGLHQSSGLGLSTVMAIVKGHQGTLSIRSVEGRGTTFVVSLPAAPAGAVDEGVTRPTALPRGRGEIVLLVDDETSILTVTGRTLTAFGYRVLTARNGVEAVAIYAQNLDRISVVLSDMMMPTMGGPALIEGLQRMNPKVKVLAASGLSADAQVAGGRNPAIKGFLAKPYTAAELLQAIRSVIDAR
jgi:PAS domain S-box-containing protein